LLPPSTTATRREQAREADGARPHVHLAVCKIELAFLRIGGAIGQNQLEGVLAEVGLAQFRRRKAALKIEIFLLADREVNLDRIERRDGRDGGAGWTDQRSDL
jgi:hypothetical protein